MTSSAPASRAPAGPRRRLWWLSGGIFGLVFGTFLLACAGAPIADPDFWWHLKTGQWMVRQGGLLAADPFSYTSDGLVTSREQLILQGYWLWELVVYGCYALFGFGGIVLYRLLTLLAMALAVIWPLRRDGVHPLVIILLLSLGFYLFSAAHYLERPQVYSFLLATVLVGRLGAVRYGGRLGWGIPLLMLVWANVHGGYFVGVVILGCFALGVAIHWRRQPARLRSLLGWCGLGVLASLLNPTGLLVYRELLSFYDSQLMAGVQEYRSTWAAFVAGDTYLVVLWLLVAVALAGFLFRRGRYWPWLLAAGVLSVLCLSYTRNVGFALALLPIAGANLQAGMRRLPPGWPARLAVPVIGACCALLVWQGNGFWQQRREEGPINNFYPTAATDFIQTAGLRGRIFNSYDHGGYLIWRLFPERQVFVDGRGLQPETYRDYRTIAAASLNDVTGTPEYQVLLQQYGIDYVMQQLFYTDSGRLSPLLKFLLNEPVWAPVYVDELGYILVRRNGKNAAVIAAYGMDKRAFVREVLTSLKLYSRRWPERVAHHVAYAEMLIFAGDYATAEQQLALVRQLTPDHAALAPLRKQLRALDRTHEPTRSSGP